MSENDLSKKIRDLRTMHGLTLEQVAKKVGVGKSTVRKWETGIIANMRRDKIAKLAEALHTTPAYLMGWEEHSDKYELFVGLKQDSFFQKPLIALHTPQEGNEENVLSDSGSAAADDEPCLATGETGYGKSQLIKQYLLATEVAEARQENTNILRMAGRDGTFIERALTDDQMAAIKAMLNAMPDASEDL